MLHNTCHSLVLFDILSSREIVLLMNQVEHLIDRLFYLISGYTNIDGGYGLFSSCITIEKKPKLNHRALLDLYRQPWGFVEN